MKQKRKQRVKSDKPRKVSFSKFRKEYGHTIKELEKIFDVSCTKIYEWHNKKELWEMLKNKT